MTRRTVSPQGATTLDVRVRRGIAANRLLLIVSGTAFVLAYAIWHSNSSGNDTSTEELGVSALHTVAATLPVLVLSAFAEYLLRARPRSGGFVVGAVAWFGFLPNPLSIAAYDENVLLGVGLSLVVVAGAVVEILALRTTLTVRRSLHAP